MSLFLVIGISTILFWIFASTDFAINMTVFWAMFGLLEWANKLIGGKTISRKFWEWADTVPRWRVWVVSGILAVVGIYFTLHLALEV